MKLTDERAIEDYRKLTYDLAKLIGKLKYIKERVEYINREKEWDGMFEISFSNALENLADVQAAMVIYSYEDQYEQKGDE